MLRFSIRDVLWLTVVVGMGIGWWIDRSRLRGEILSERAIGRIIHGHSEDALNERNELAAVLDEVDPNWTVNRAPFRYVEVEHFRDTPKRRAPR